MPHAESYLQRGGFNMKRTKNIVGACLVVLGFTLGVITTRLQATLQTRQATADALVTAPEQYKIEFENEFVRVSRVKYAARAKVPMHTHPAPGGVIVALTDQDARLTAPDGSRREVHYKAGQVRWAPSTPQVDATTQSAHAEENLSEKSFELIRIDPKTR